MKKIKLGDVAKIITGPFGSQLHSSDYVTKGIALVMPINIGDRYIIEDSIAKISELDAKRLSRYKLELGDIVYSRRGDVEKCALVRKRNVGFLCGTGCLRIRVDKNLISPDFLSLYLSQNYIKKWVLDNSNGATMPNLNSETLIHLPLNLPSLEIQKKISTILSAFDEKISINKKINATLEAMAKTIYDYWFLQFDFPDENGKPYKSSGGKMIYNAELKREIPFGWEVKKLSSLLIKNSTPFNYQTTAPTIDLSVMPSNSISLDKLNSSDLFSTNLFEMKEGDILFGSIRPYLKKAGIAPCDGVFAGTIYSYKVKNFSDYNFALSTLCNENFFNYAIQISTGTRMPAVNNEVLLSYKVAYSEKIAELFNRIDIKKFICKNCQENFKLETLRDFLLPMLMNGQVKIEGG